ncbi:MAG: NYN domain-containing protein [Paracoccaceae bacterium]
MASSADWFSLQPMRVPFLLFILFAAGTLFAALVPGLSDVALVTGLAAFAAFLLLLGAGMAPRGPRRRYTPWTTAPDPCRLIVDGSNVMHWRDNVPDLATLRAVLRQLAEMGYRPEVTFDANAGYLVAGGFKNSAAFAALLGLPRHRVHVVHKGTVADTYILQAAKRTQAPIISNDRYRDWEGDHPEIREPGRLIRGGWAKGQPWVDLAPLPASQAAA